MNATLSVLPSSHAAQARSLAGFLRHMPALERAGEEALLSLAERSELRRYRRGTHVWQAGALANEVYWVRSGVVWIHQESRAGREVSIGYSGRGSLLGLQGSGPSGQRNDVASVHEDLAVVAVRRAAFDAWLAQWPSVVPAIVGAATDALSRMQARVALIGLHGAKARLAGLLLELGRTFGVRDSRGVIIDLRLTHRELAQLIGATRETVSVAIVEMRNEGIIDTEQRRVILIDADAVTAIADQG